MTAAAKLKHTAVSLDFASARTEYFAMKTERKKLIARCDRIQLALNLATMPEPLHPRAAIAVEAAGDELALARRNPRRSELALYELRDKLDDARPAFERAKEQYETACSDEARRIAEALIPRHRAAVAKIDAALELLASALTAEIDVRTEFEKSSPTPWPSQLLPNMSASLLRLAWTSHRDSTASSWRREARAKGLLE